MTDEAFKYSDDTLVKLSEICAMAHTETDQNLRVIEASELDWICKTINQLDTDLREARRDAAAAREANDKLACAVINHDRLCETDDDPDWSAAFAIAKQIRAALAPPPPPTAKEEP